jgi:hypothetical protein
LIKQLIIHIGQHKTGSTSIQSALATGKVMCPTTSLFYPGKNSHNNVARTLLRAALAEQKAARFSALAKRFAKSNADIGIISAESFEFVRPMALQRALKQFFPEHADTARIIAYVRHHAARLVSSFCERTKKGRSTAVWPIIMNGIWRKATFSIITTLTNGKAFSTAD